MEERGSYGLQREDLLRLSIRIKAYHDCLELTKIDQTVAVKLFSCLSRPFSSVVDSPFSFHLS